MYKSKKIYTIGYAARQTHLSTHVIRAWEKRYGAIKPGRTETQRRLYSESDIQRLALLREATHAGHRIAQLVELDMDSLRELADRRKAEAASHQSIAFEEPTSNGYYDASLSAVLKLDSRALEVALNRAAVMLTRKMVLAEVIFPLTEKIGELWASGKLKIVNEHMASTVLRSFLWDMMRSVTLPQGAPKIVVATPVNQWHELGALMIALLAVEAGWEALYYGPNLPSEEIAAAAVHKRVRAVALSIIYQIDEAQLLRELIKLRRYLSEAVTLVVGGRGLHAFQSSLEQIGVIQMHDVQEFIAFLNSR
jgi:DNA-binding transcriptional MerR regulator/methylmalonyl-CoA mutase cobalamin-binding subunit